MEVDWLKAPPNLLQTQTSRESVCRWRLRYANDDRKRDPQTSLGRNFDYVRCVLHPYVLHAHLGFLQSVNSRIRAFDHGSEPRIFLLWICKDDCWQSSSVM